MPVTTRRLALVCLVSLTATCARKGGGDDEASAATPPSATAVAVVLAPARRDTISDLLELVGRLEPTPGSSAILAAPTASIVRQVMVQVGGEVQAGQPLMILDAPDITARARADSAAAVVAEREARRQEGLLAQGIASAKQADEASNAATAARAAASASARLLALLTIRSPIEGAANDVRVQPGEHVDVGAPLATVMDADTLDLIVPVPAARLALVHPGLPALVSTEGDTTPHRASVHAVAPGVDSITNAGRVVVRMPDPGERIHPGTGATAHIVLGLRRNAVVVPVSALVLIGDRQAVYVVGADSVAHARSVTVAVRSGNRAAVVGALQAGEQVVTVGGAGLADGMKVAPSAARP